ncbi:MAG: protease inhibitor I42 family protein [Egibacteraceae bacterium]
MAQREISRTGEHVRLARDDVLVLRVQELASAGYRWDVDALPEQLVIESNELRTPGTDAPGAGAERMVTLRAATSGEGRVVLGLRRPWEPDGPAEQRFDVRVVVE